MVINDHVKINPIIATTTNSTIIENNLTLFNRLTSDIILDIIKFLSQKDCLQCMQVCREWYTILPTFTQELWSTLIIKGTRQSIKQTLWLQFVGDHVQNITFLIWKERDLYHIMQKLIDRNCRYLRFIKFERCNTAKQQKFLPLLKQLGSYTTHLDMEEHGSNVAFLDVFEACPRLTHFTFTNPSIHAYTLHGLYDKEPIATTIATSKISSLQETKNYTSLSLSSSVSSTYNVKQQLQQKWKNKPIHENIISLILDVVLEKHIRLESILRKCPNLRHLVCSNGEITKRSLEEEEEDIFPSYDTTIPDLDDLLSWCPKLHYLEINTDQGYQSNQLCSVFHDFYESDKNGQQHSLNGLQYFMTYEGDDYGAERIGPFLIRNASTLKCVILARSIATITPDQDWSFMFETIPLCPYLDTLVLINITYEDSALVSMLEQCPQLQTLIIRNTLLMPLKLTSILSPLQRLKHLELDSVSLQMDTDDDSGDSPVHLFQQLSKEEPDGYSLEDIWLTNVPEVTDDLLIATTYIPTIKNIRIMLDSRLYRDDGLVLFGQRLCLTAIESLELNRIRLLSFDFLYSLGELPSLKTLCIQATYGMDGKSRHVLVDGPGLAHMLCKSKSLQYVSIEEADVEKGSEISQEQVDIIHKKYDMTPYGRRRPSRLICQRRI
ncbi:hypothetical protein INT45_012464 [Circinella minor]|uniref:F-box domain-containing protein n=1 Tax=Circinella minor TaxID=1195481 RepID=A0A8H7S199_9FUNG|nr:hypothetical protein INT45_012464 [Circinella minor]